MKRKTVAIRRGYLFIEVLVVIAVLGIASVVLSEAFQLAIRSMGRTAEAQNRWARTDGAVARLRSDIWQSREVRATTAGDSLRVVMADRTVRWDIDPAGTLSRTVEPGGLPEPSRSWAQTAEHWSFRAEDASVELVDTSPNGGRVTFISQLSLDRLEQR